MSYQNLTQAQLFERSRQLIPGGVHSPVRSFKGLHTTPRFIKSAQGAYLSDVDNNNYIDFCMSFGPLILGHKDPIVEEKLHGALKNGWSYGACEPYSLELAEYLLERLPFADQIRFVSSGTEAVMSALRLARGATGKNKLIKFNGCYHGHMDSMLIKAGSGLAGEAEASSAGVPKGVAEDTLIVELDDLQELKACFERYPDDIAAIVVEPLPANNGLMPQSLEFLTALRSLCDQYKSLLIFDEVISGFRVGFQGMAGETSITPDIVTYGKIIGGGLPVGAIAAKKEIMENFAPIGRVYQAGTLSANPMAMVGGLANISQCNDELYATLKTQTQKIVGVFENWLRNFDGGRYAHFKIVQKESLFWLVPSDVQPRRIDQIPAHLTESFNPLFAELLNRGIYLSPNAYEIGFVSRAHDDQVINDLEERLNK